MSQPIREIERMHASFIIGVGGVRYQGHLATNGRWYYRRIVSGRTTDSASYASRRSCRRAILSRIARGDV